VLIIFLTVLCALSAQKRANLAGFPFTGGIVSDGESLAASLARQPVLRNAFNNNVTLVTQNTIRTLNLEQRFQRNTGLMYTDSIFELGKALEDITLFQVIL
jgi:hypothetical protein